MGQTDIILRPITGFAILHACQTTPEGITDAADVVAAIQKQIFQKDDAKVEAVGPEDRQSLISPTCGLGIVAFTSTGIDIPFTLNSLLAVVHVNSNAGFRTTASFYEMGLADSSALSTDGQLAEKKELQMESPAQDEDTIWVTEDVLFRSKPLSTFGDKYGRYVLSDGETYILTHKISAYGKQYRAKVVRIGDEIKTDSIGRYLIPAYTLVWSGSPKDKYGVPRKPDNIVDESVICASQKPGYFGSHGQEETKENGQDAGL